MFPNRSSSRYSFAHLKTKTTDERNVSKPIFKNVFLGSFQVAFQLGQRLRYDGKLVMRKIMMIMVIIVSIIIIIIDYRRRLTLSYVIFCKRGLLNSPVQDTHSERSSNKHFKAHQYCHLHTDAPDEETMSVLKACAKGK